MDVPALGYKVVKVGSEPVQMRAVKRFAASEEGALAFERRRGRLRQWIKSRGCITSIKMGGRRDLAPNACGNQLQFFKDLPKQYDAWNIDPGTLDVAADDDR